jgi:two-component system cell cycle sensor histidine kinase/response regulator CckA
MAFKTLEKFGYRVLLAEDGQEAVNLFRAAPEEISVVLLDLTMPVMSGEEAFRQLRTIQPAVKVVVSSGYNEVEAVRHFTAKGIAGFIQKPYTASQLAEKIAGALDQV